MIRRRFEKILAAPPSEFMPVLVPLALLYGMAAFFHRWLYTAGILKRARLPRPVVSVGNLTAGGGGKTPLVMWLAGALVDAGLRPAILSRGYGSESGTVRIVDPRDGWRVSGDEPYLMAKRLPDVPVAVSAKRHLAGLELLKRREVDIFILDDGFQHHALERDLEIIAVDNHRRFGTGRLLPAGVLREPVKRIGDADFVVVTKSGGPDPDFGKYLSGLTRGRVLWAGFVPVGLRPVEGEAQSRGMSAPGGPFLAFCGIADPEGFRSTLESLGIKTLELLAYPDHHPYGDEDVKQIQKAARKLGARALVTTEKDAVRWPGGHEGLPCYMTVMEMVVPPAASFLVQCAADLVGGERKVSS